MKNLIKITLCLLFMHDFTYGSTNIENEIATSDKAKEYRDKRVELLGVKRRGKDLLTKEPSELGITSAQRDNEIMWRSVQNAELKNNLAAFEASLTPEEKRIIVDNYRD